MDIENKKGLKLAKSLGLAGAMPVVAIFGSDDWIFTPSVRAFVAKLPTATLHMVATGKHHLYRHLPEQFHSLVGAALQEE